MACGLSWNSSKMLSSVSAGERYSWLVRSASVMTSSGFLGDAVS